MNKIFYITIFKDGKPFKELRSDSQEYWEYKLENRFKPHWDWNGKLKDGFNIWDSENDETVLDKEDIFDNEKDCLQEIEKIKNQIRIGHSRVN
jgi:hypothetical protein